MFELTLIAALTLIGSAIGTITGFGTSTIMIPALLFYYPLPQTLLLVGIIHFAGNIWKMVFFHRGLQWRLLLLFGVPSILASYLGATMTSSFDEQLLLRMLGAVFLLYTLFLLLHSTWKIPANATTAVGGGLASGFMAGMFGVGGAGG